MSGVEKEYQTEEIPVEEIDALSKLFDYSNELLQIQERTRTHNTYTVGPTGQFVSVFFKDEKIIHISKVRLGQQQESLVVRVMEGNFYGSQMNLNSAVEERGHRHEYIHRLYKTRNVNLDWINEISDCLKKALEESRFEITHLN